MVPALCVLSNVALQCRGGRRPTIDPSAQRRPPHDITVHFAITLQESDPFVVHLAYAPRTTALFCTSPGATRFWRHSLFASPGSSRASGSCPASPSLYKPHDHVAVHCVFPAREQAASPPSDKLVILAADLATAQLAWCPSCRRQRGYPEQALSVTIMLCSAIGRAVDAPQGHPSFATRHICSCPSIEIGHGHSRVNRLSVTCSRYALVALLFVIAMLPFDSP